MKRIPNDLLDKLEELANILEKDDIEDFKKNYVEFIKWITSDLWLYRYGHPQRERFPEQQWEWERDKNQELKKIAKTITSPEKFSKVVDIISGEEFDLDLILELIGKHALLEEITFEFIDAFLESCNFEELQIDVKGKVAQIEKKAEYMWDFGVLYARKAVHEKLGNADIVKRIESRIDALSITNQVKMSIYKDIEGIYKDLRQNSLDLENKYQDLTKKHDVLESDLEKNRIRLVETLGLFAAIIAFVIAGIVGLQGLTATGIAISITGLTAGLVVLVTLINIFTSPKTYIWGKVAVLGIAFFTLIAWMVVTVFFKLAIFR